MSHKTSPPKQGGKPFRLEPEKADALRRLLEHYLSDCPPASMERLSRAAKAHPETGLLIWELAWLKDIPLVVSDGIFHDMLRFSRKPECNDVCAHPAAPAPGRGPMPFYDGYPEIEPNVRRALLLVRNGRGHVFFNVRTRDRAPDADAIRELLGGVDFPRPAISHHNTPCGAYYRVSACGVPEKDLFAAVDNVEAVAMALLLRKELKQCPSGESLRLARELGMEPDE